MSNPALRPRLFLPPEGAFKPISDVLTYRVEPGNPAKVTVVPPAQPAAPPPGSAKAR
jgi:hypothetical protein